MGRSSGGRFRSTRRQAALLVLAAPMLIAGGFAARAESAGGAAPAEAAPTETAPRLGPVTHLPLPRYVSLKTTKGYARRGPDFSHRIDWVFTREGMPLKITAEYEHWRRVEDQDGLGGWVHYSLLSGVRTVVVTRDMSLFRDRPVDSAPLVFKAERNVIGRLLACTKDWAKVVVEGDGGWALKGDLWGVDPGEVFG